MDITKKTKEEFENRLDRIEEFIASKGIGARYLKKAKKTQRDVNIALVLLGIVSISGIAFWVNSREK